MRILITIALFSLALLAGGFFLFERSARNMSVPVVEVVSDDPAPPTYDELPRGPVLYSSDVPAGVLLTGRPEDVSAPASAEPGKRRTANSAVPRPKAEVVIRDNYFVGMVTDLTTNMHDYDGKTVQYEGFVRNIEPEFGPAEPFAVCRLFYCCGEDAYLVGLPCDGYKGKIPKDDEWVVVTGVMGIREDEGGEYPYLGITHMAPLPESGETYVYQ